MGLTCLHAVVGAANQQENEPQICEIIELLLSEGALISLDIYPTPGQLARANGLHEAAKLLEEHAPKASLLDSPLSLALPGQAEMLLDLGADINERNEEGTSPIARTITREIHETTRLLLDRGADITTIDNQGWTLLHCIAIFGRSQESADIAEELINRGLDVNAKCHAGQTPFHLAQYDKNPAIIAVFEKHGAY